MQILPKNAKKIDEKKRKKKKELTKIFWNIEVWALQKRVNLVDLVKSFPTSIDYLLAEFGFDTAENEPLKVRQKIANVES